MGRQAKRLKGANGLKEDTGLSRTLNPRLIDALIAEHVMGMFDVEKKMQHFGYGAIPGYSTKIEAAWKVVEKLDDKFRVGIIKFSMEYKVKFVCRKSRNINSALDLTAPMAICLAALKAKGVEI